MPRSISEQKIKFWKRHVLEHDRMFSLDETGVRKYCHMTGLKEQDFYFWRRQLWKQGLVRNLRSWRMQPTDKEFYPPLPPFTMATVFEIQANQSNKPSQLRELADAFKRGKDNEHP